MAIQAWVPADLAELKKRKKERMSRQAL